LDELGLEGMAMNYTGSLMDSIHD